MRFAPVSRDSNLPIADFVSEYLEAGGCTVRRHDYADGQKVNLVAWKGPLDRLSSADGRLRGRGISPSADADGLTLCGHLDVVPADDPGWESDPFTLTERAGRLVGRGTVDMLSFVALAMNRVVAASASALRAPLALLLTADEEIGGVGAQQLLDSPAALAVLPRDVLIGEPTQLRAVRMNKGHLKARVAVRGRSAHSGYPQLGVNAIGRAAEIVRALVAQAEAWRSVRVESSAAFAECPFPVLNVARIAGGGALNIVPDSCEIAFGVRLLPGQRSEAALNEIRAAIGGVSAAWADDARLEVINDNPPMLCPPEARINRILCDLLGQAESLGVSYASDGGPLAAVGFDCVLFGAGDMEYGHRANESIGLGEFEAGGRRLDTVIMRFCGVADA